MCVCVCVCVCVFEFVCVFMYVCVLCVVIYGFCLPLPTQQIYKDIISSVSQLYSFGKHTQSLPHNHDELRKRGRQVLEFPSVTLF